MKLSISKKGAINLIFIFLYEKSCFANNLKPDNNNPGNNAHPDLITSMPGLKFKINFKHYSGYLNAGEGKLLHYWFIECKESPDKAPVLLWLNGGPGCSSLDGLLSELGPFHIRHDGETLYENPYSWNNVANVIFLETPAGVGFSYSGNKNYTTDDDLSADNNYMALQSFFQKFPQYQKNEFYLTGESYAGVYIPTLSLRILQGKANINFKGFAIGNGSLNKQLLSHSLLFFGYYHGLIGIQFWETVTKNCCNGTASQSSCRFSGPNVPKSCWKVGKRAVHHIHSRSLNIYNILEKCVQDGTSSRYAIDISSLLGLFPSEFLEVGAESKKTSQPDTGKAHCTDAANVTHFLNLRSVREALHIPKDVPDWQQCNHDLHPLYTKIYQDLRPSILNIMKYRKLRVLIYNGDVDTICNYLGNEWFAISLGLPLITEFAEWNYNGQIAGFVVEYQNLTFMTVKGSGHMVPHDKPGEALQLITRFLKNEPQYDRQRA